MVAPVSGRRLHSWHKNNVIDRKNLGWLDQYAVPKNKTN